MPKSEDQSADLVASESSGGVLDIATTRAAQEVQAAMIIAKRFPRDETAAMNRILTSCKRIKLAEVAIYAYPKGGQIVTGPSIRLAEAMAQGWGNLDFGIIELSQSAGKSEMMAYAWDLETNARQTKVFCVKHWRDTRQGGYGLTDQRDIYELTANQGARRMRACILGIIPGDIQDAAVEQCEKTLRGDSKEPLIDRIRKMVGVFADMGVSKEMIETRLGHNIDACIEPELVTLRKIYQSLKDNMAKREQFFEVGDATPGSTTIEELTIEMEDKPGQKPTKQKAKRSKVKRATQEQAEAEDGDLFDKSQSAVEAGA